MTACLNIVYTPFMEAKIQKWGNSLGVRIPAKIVKELYLKNGSRVEIDEEIDRIVIRPKEKYDLDTLIQEISEKNLHSAADFGIAEGNEYW